MSSDESDLNVDNVDNFDSDSDFIIDEDIFANGIHPFCFEPIYSASEINEHMNTSEEHMESDKSEQHVESESSVNSMDWCICKHCSLDRNITDKICCRNPMILPDDKFTDVDCITETETFNFVCLNKEILRTSMADLERIDIRKRALVNVNVRFIGYKQYISWSYVYLGKKKRTPLPNCVLKKIR